MMLLLVFLIPLITAILCLVVDQPKWLGRIQTIGMATLMIAVWSLIRSILQHGSLQNRFPVPHLFYLDAFSGWMLVVITAVSFLVSLYSQRYMIHEDEQIGLKQLKTYYLLLNLFIATMLVLVCLNNLGLFWIAIEITTLISAFLVGFYRKNTAVEAAWKYIILCTVGIAFALIGLVVAYLAVSQVVGHTEQGLDWAYLLTLSHRLNPDLMKLAFVFILIGFGGKAGLAPLHAWLPDAHSEAPSPISALLSGVLLKCGLYGIVRFGMLANLSVGYNFAGEMLLFFGLLSLFIATPFILTQLNIKRLLAYSSLEHIGIIAIGLGFGTPLALFGSLFHILNHALSKSLMFFSAGNLTVSFLTKRIEHLQGAFQKAPVSALFLMLGTLAVTGSPPFSLFLSEFYILKGGLDAQHWISSIVYLVLLVIIFGGLLYHTLKIFIGQPEPSERLGASSSGYLLEQHASNILPLAVSTILLVLLTFWMPSALGELLQQSVTILIRGGWR